jgi:hypothetical protein
MTKQKAAGAIIINILLIAVITAGVGSVVGWGGWVTKRSVDHGERISGIDSKLDMIQGGVEQIQQTLNERNDQ